MTFLAFKINTAKLITSCFQAVLILFFIRRTHIRRAAEGEFPGDDIPTFRNNIDAKKRLDKLVNQLAEACSIKEVNFGEGIL